MADVQVIIDRIAADAQAQADAIVQSARERADRAVAAAKQAAADEERKLEAALEIESRDILARKKTVAALEVRKVRLGAVTEAIDRTYRLALDKLCALSEKDYVALADKLLTAYAEQGDEVVLSADAPVKQIAGLKVFEERGLTLSDKRGTFRGGVFLVGKTYDKDLTFESLLAAIRPSTEGEVLARIGGEN